MDKDKEIARLRALLEHEIKASIKSSHYRDAIWKEWQRQNNIPADHRILEYRKILRRQKYQIIDDFVLEQFDKHFGIC